MSIEIVGLLITTLGVVVAFFTWWFPRHSKATINPAEIEVTQHKHLATPDYRNQIEVAHKHLDATTFDDERTKYISDLARRIGFIELIDLAKLVTYLVHDENRVKAVKAFSGKIHANLTAKHYEELMNEFVHSDNKQKVASYINKR